MESLPTHITGVQLNKGIPGSKPVIASIPMPPIDGTKALIKMIAAPINPSDLLWMRGDYPAGKTEISFSGIEGTGIVIALGPDVDEGMREALMGKRVSFFLGGSDQGSWSNYVVIESANLIPLPDCISDDQAACALVNPLTVELILFKCEQEGHTVIVHGAASSSLGLMLIQASKAMAMRRAADERGSQDGSEDGSSGAGAITIINLVRRPENVERVWAAGGEYVVDMSVEGWEDEFAALVEALKPSAYFDPISGPTGSKVVSLMTNGSTTYNYGGLDQAFSYTINVPELLFKGKILKGMWIAVEMSLPEVAPILIHNMFANLTAGVYRTRVYAKYPMSRFEEALKVCTVQASRGKVLLIPDF